MTEADWLQGTDPLPMLDFLLGKASDRKLRLFAVACCRRIGHLLADAKSRMAVETAERYADKAASDRALAAAADCSLAGADASWAANAAFSAAEPASYGPIGSDDYLPYLPVACNAAIFASLAVRLGDLGHFAEYTEGVAQASLVRDIFGNPFGPVALDPAWLTPPVVALAQSIYEERAFDRLPVLADVLEATGCTDANLLAHCREPGLHARGCWVVDAVLGKE